MNTLAFNKPMSLGELFVDVAGAELEQAGLQVSGVCLDSRLAEAGDLYLAVDGASTHGLHYLDAALARNIAAVAVDTAELAQYPAVPAQLQARAVPLLKVPGLKGLCGMLAARFYREPSQALEVVAITGTDGKTSVCRFVADALRSIGCRCGYIGTLGWGVDELQETALTTPDVVSMQRMLACMHAAGAEVIALEASSHGLDTGRLDDVAIDVAVLTNFGRDHLDYHLTLEAYKAAKARLFSWPGLKCIVVNADDELGAELARTSTHANILFYPRGQARPDNSAIRVQVDNIRLHDDGMQFELLDNGQRFDQTSPLLGRFNVDNLLACHAVLRALGQAANDASMALGNVQPVPGRMEKITSAGEATAIIDYSHTPQALSSALAAVREHCRGQLWVVFGCGGDRDPGKRGPMGQAAEAADHIIVTNDNPRTEDPETILEAIIAGMREPQRAVVIADRHDAIAHALGNAASNDMVLIAGKGHEDYQLIGTEKRHFSDRETVQQLLQEAG